MKMKLSFLQHFMTSMFRFSNTWLFDAFSLATVFIHAVYLRVKYMHAIILVYYDMHVTLCTILKWFRFTKIY